MTVEEAEVKREECRTLAKIAGDFAEAEREIEALKAELSEAKQLVLLMHDWRPYLLCRAQAFLGLTTAPTVERAPDLQQRVNEAEALLCAWKSRHRDDAEMGRRTNDWLLEPEQVERAPERCRHGVRLPHECKDCIYEPEPSLIDQVREVVAETSEIASPHRESDAMLFLSDQAVGFQRIRDLLSTPSAQKPGGGE